MGASVCAGEPEPQDVECHTCVHPYLFPMYLVKVTDFLQMEGVPEPHHVLQEKGLLHEWQPGMFVIFISHQWLGAKQPDPTGSQLAVLRQTLRGLIDGSLRVEVDITSMDLRRALQPTALQQVQQGYLFLDWFAIPQITARMHGINEVEDLETTRSEAALAVQSIPAYVEACDLFLALVPDLVHSDTGKSCNYLSWLSRGWCRAELWCRLLSNRDDTSVVVVFSAKEAEFIFPLDWQQNRISDGLFTVESDREEVVKLGEMALASKLEHLRRNGPLTHYRFYLARRPQLMNQDTKPLDLQGFLQLFDFPNVDAAVKEDGGMTGMLCAVLAGDAKMVHTLVEHRGDANGRAAGLSDLGYYDSQTLLMVAAKSYQDPVLLSTLISLHADVNLMSRAEISPLWLARHPGHVRVLLAARAEHKNFPMNGVSGRGSAETVRVFLESRCDPSQGTEDGFSPLFSIPLFGRSNPDAYATTRLLVSYRADVNFRAAPNGMMGWEGLVANVQVGLWGMEGCGSYWRKLASMPGATPLGVAALTGDKGLVELLLELDADVEIANNRGHTPEVLARNTSKELTSATWCGQAAHFLEAMKKGEALAMGALCSSERPPVHVCRFPMYVVKVSDFLKMEGAPEPHDVLLEKNVLHKREPGMFVIFVSHQWLGSEHPDPEGKQLKVLRCALRRMLDGVLSVEEDLTSMTPQSRLAHADINRLSPETMRKIGTGYLFLDWFAIPQITARKHGVNEETTRSDAALAVQSIPRYVEASDLFVALVPELTHTDTGLPCNYTSWLSRGWCRAELWCRLLSNKVDTRVVVVFSPREAELMFPLDWQRNLIADGRFTVESDRSTVVKLGEVALQSKLETLQHEGPLSHYRFYLAFHPRLLGQQPEDLTCEDFLRYFLFPTVDAAVSDGNAMNGLLCAVLSGNVPMIRCLVEKRADVNYRITGLNELGYYETQTLLMAAAKSHQEPEVLSALVSLRADVHAQARSCAFVARSPGQVTALLRARADFLGAAALNGAASRANTETVAALLKSRCDPDYPVDGKYGAIHALALFGRGNPRAAENLKLLLEHKALVNRKARPQGQMARECELAQEFVKERGLENSSTLVRTWSSLPGISTLGCAALVGDSSLVKLLLEARAEASVNDRGNLPFELAEACGHRHLLPLLETTFHA